MTDTAIAELAPEVGVRAACEVLGVAQASYYRRHRQSPPPQRPQPIPHRDRHQPRALSEAERQAILEQLHSDRFGDVSPTEVWATLLDEGVYLGSISTFYRLLRQAGQSRERRRQATHPATVKPELVATAPNQVWSWDITKLRGPVKWTYYHLYVILDVYSRYVVGWMVATRESAALAQVLIRQTCAKQGIRAEQLLCRQRIRLRRFVAGRRRRTHRLPRPLRTDTDTDTGTGPGPGPGTWPASRADVDRGCPHDEQAAGE